MGAPGHGRQPRLAAAGLADRAARGARRLPLGRSRRRDAARDRAGAAAGLGRAGGATIPPARAWAVAGGALLVARELFVAGRRLPAVAEASARRLLGTAAPTATSLAEFAALVPATGAGGARRACEDPPSLWRAEARWWARWTPTPPRCCAGRGSALRAGGRRGRGVAAVDAWRVCAALECAARGGRDLEVFDAVA